MAVYAFSWGKEDEKQGGLLVLNWGKKGDVDLPEEKSQRKRSAKKEKRGRATDL